MSGIIIAIVVLVVAAIVGFVAFVILYHLKQRRNGMPTSSIIPPADAFKSAFGRGSNNRSGGGGSGSGFGGTFGLGRLGGGGGEERSTRFAALEYDLNQAHLNANKSSVWTKPGTRMSMRKWDTDKHEQRINACSLVVL